MIETIHPSGWPPARGYVNGMAGSGRLLFVAGQIGWEPTTGRFEVHDFPGQFSQALANVLAVVHAAGGSAEHVVRMTIYVTDLPAYRASAKALGAAWRAHFGRHYPAMALVGVAGLVEPSALIEIEATALLPEVNP